MVTVSLASNATAQQKTFQDHIQLAKEAFDAENYQVAIDNLLAADRLEPNARLLLNVAKSYDKLNNCSKAIVYYKAFLRAPDAEVSLKADAEKAVKESGSCQLYNADMAGRLIIKSDPPGASVRVDGVDRGVTPFEIGGLAKGTRLVTVSLEGYDDSRQEVELVPDGDKTVLAALQKSVAQVVDPDEPEVPIDEPEVVESDERGAAPYYIAAGVGVVGLALVSVGLVTDLSTIPGIDDDREALDVNAADYNERFDALTSDRDSAASLALITYISGGVLIAGSLGYLGYLLATESPKQAPPVAGDFRIAPAIGPNVSGVQLNVVF